MVLLTLTTIDPSPLRAFVQRPEAGAILSFEGCTRDNFAGKRVVELQYEAYESMAKKELSALIAAIQQEHPETRIAVAHRLGIVPIGETSVLTVVSAPHRDEAYTVSRRVIDQLKLQIPIWKKEIYTQGASWKENKA